MKTLERFVSYGHKLRQFMSTLREIEFSVTSVIFVVRFAVKMCQVHVP